MVERSGNQFQFRYRFRSLIPSLDLFERLRLRRLAIPGGLRRDGLKAADRRGAS